jgi:uncharacterized membrane protein
MNWFDRIRPALNFVAFFGAAYVAVIFGQMVAQLIEQGGLR